MAAVRMQFGVSPTHPVRISFGAIPVLNPVCHDVHFELELGIVTHGSVRRLYSDGYHQDYHEGEIWFHGMWEPHGWTSLEPETHAVIAMIWPSFFIDLRLSDSTDIHWMLPFVSSPQNRPTVPLSLKPNLLRMAYTLAALGAAKRPLHDGHPCSRAEKKAHEAQEDTARTRDPHSARTPMLANLLILQVLTLLLTDPANKHLRSCASASFVQTLSPALMLVFSSHTHVSLEDAAAVCRIAPSAFSQKFQKAMGITFGQFALRRRLSCATKQLVSTHDPIKRIAMEWGFANESHFCRSFEQTYQCTPSEYRRIKTKKSGPALF